MEMMNLDVSKVLAAREYVRKAVPIFVANRRKLIRERAELGIEAAQQTVQAWDQEKKRKKRNRLLLRGSRVHPDPIDNSEVDHDNEQAEPEPAVKEPEPAANPVPPESQADTMRLEDDPVVPAASGSSHSIVAL